MHALALSGWGQPHDALSAVLPQAAFFDYAAHDGAAQALEALALAAKDVPLLVGWSLGAQLLLRAAAAGLVRPKRLVLIAPPFQFVAREALPLGMTRWLYTRFHENYRRNPQRTLDKAWELVAQDDAHAPQVQEYMQRQDKAAVLAHDWGRWLDELERFSCDGLDFSILPPSLLVHGACDAVVEAGQSAHLADVLPQATLVTLPGCGHAPHWHAPQALARLIVEHGHD